MSERPKTIRGVFLLTVLKMIISFTFFAVFTIKEINPEAAEVILYTSLAYVALAIPMFTLIHKNSAAGVRTFIILAIFAGIPAKAFIGVALDLVALGLTFTKPSQTYFRTKKD